MAFVQYELVDHIATITMNRPERLNALGPDMGPELRAALKRFIFIRPTATCSGI